VLKWCVKQLCYSFGDVVCVYRFLSMLLKLFLWCLERLRPSFGDMYILTVFSNVFKAVVLHC